ncbi:NPP1 domain-containing protein [Colletotrichum truncatum]|uniref:NPP1 domain-containing protein n=1 Tax=Colletotrichum truncatum TaxID=5467 RepID=A0ACC3YHC8_COLTU|nr:NPP1 domain-containing protein [Colletotrichum truncatum]KAF6792858.1 NPP1 domain-containing protein [Colletotrichum truncatum]
MLRHSLTSLLLLGLATFTSGRALSPRDGDVAIGDKFKDHDDIKAFEQAASDGTPGELELRFKPGLNDASGCFPYAAVDKDGYHGAGLKPTGKSGGKCRDPALGQVYSRVGVSNGRTAVLYSWYIPKIMTDSDNHKHWYLSVVVWLHTDKCGAMAADYSIAGVSYSNGKETFDTTMSSSTIYSSGDSNTGAVNTHPIVGYDGQVGVFPSDDSAIYALTPPMISWDKLSTAAREQFNGIQYEHARCPFTDNNFQYTLDASYNANFYDKVPAEPAADCGATPTTSTADPGSTDPTSSGTPTEPLTYPSATTTDDVEPIEDGPEINPSSMPADPTYTPTPGDGQ